MAEQRIDLGLTASSPAGGGCGDGCGCGGVKAVPTPSPATAANDVLSVEGMTCDHCVRAVTEELSALEGVDVVWVDLRVGDASLVRIARTADVSDDDIAAAIDEAGYTLSR
ncbi:MULTISPECIES: heavy-metal-associated domain-containing protein [Microbacterium]|uniref:heavy-metal-associated domain-containing protein n=1 Tax=Microbacterium TaxID=33882 RepID=UPI002785FD34|nr:MULTISPECIES: cation transporter [Microbacterium]MDQ1084890.1 copper chaperone [Microbacterium sp. SORGH_AS_0344]MDQ1169832.1 copper chaperone [Microbacterium proteolyticum]